MIPVVAVALMDVRGRVLMQRRRLGGAHGGLWEFPGGKIEPGEFPVDAAIRELAEELGIDLRAEDLAPLTFAALPGEACVILFYTCRNWSGEPRCLVADELRWVAAGKLAELPMPPLDIPLAAALARMN